MRKPKVAISISSVYHPKHGVVACGRRRDAHQCALLDVRPTAAAARLSVIVVVLANGAVHPATNGAAGLEPILNAAPQRVALGRLRWDIGAEPRQV